MKVDVGGRDLGRSANVGNNLGIDHNVLARVIGILVRGSVVFAANDRYILLIAVPRDLIARIAGQSTLRRPVSSQADRRSPGEAVLFDTVGRLIGPAARHLAQLGAIEAAKPKGMLPIVTKKGKQIISELVGILRVLLQIEGQNGDLMGHFSVPLPACVCIGAHRKDTSSGFCGCQPVKDRINITFGWEKPKIALERK